MKKKNHNTQESIKTRYSSIERNHNMPKHLHRSKVKELKTLRNLGLMCCHHGQVTI